MAASRLGAFGEPTRDAVYFWLLDTLRSVALEDAQVCIFLMSLKDKYREWQLGADMVSACVGTGLIKLFPSADEGGCPNDETVLRRLFVSDPEQIFPADAREANIWGCTYVIGTKECQGLLARHGFLECKTALILARVIDERLASGEVRSSDGAPIIDISPERAARLRALAEQSSKVEREAPLEVRRQAFVAELNAVLEAHSVVQNCVVQS